MNDVLLSKGQGLDCFCDDCKKQVIAVIKKQELLEDVQYIGQCPVCGKKFVNDVIDLNNAWLREENYIFKRGGVFFVVPGDPVPQGRPRFASCGGKFIHAYDPPKSVEYKRLIQWHIRFFMGRHKEVVNLKDNIFMDLKVFRKIPDSFSKKKREEAKNHLLLPNTKPDTDNYVKIVLDAANGFVFHDDSAVVGFMARKFYSDMPRIEVSFVSLDCNEIKNIFSSQLFHI